MKGRAALALLHDFRGAIARPHPYKEVDMIGLDSERQNLPPMLRTLTCDQLPAACGHRLYQHRLAAAWAPDEVIDDEMDAVFISLVLVCLFHGLHSTTEKTNRHGVGLRAKATQARLTARGNTLRLSAGSFSHFSTASPPTTQRKP